MKEKNDNIKGLKNELYLKIEECNILHKELSKRPFVIKASCNLVKYPANNTNAVKEITDKLDAGKKHYVNANYKDKFILTLRPVMADEQIFYGLVVGIQVVGIQNECDININDFVEFQVSDLYYM